jgi:hypothetical protein
LVTTDFLALLYDFIDPYGLLIPGELNGAQVLIEVSLDKVNELVTREDVEMDQWTINALPRVNQFIHEFYCETSRLIIMSH